MFKIKTNKGGIGIADLAVAVFIINVIGLIFVSTITFTTMNMKRGAEKSTVNVLLTDCMEAIQGIRYGEFDLGGVSGWDNFKYNYPTGLYKLSFDEDNKSRALNPIYSDPDNEVIYNNIQEIFTLNAGHDDTNRGELINFDPSDPRNTAERYVYLNTSAVSSIQASCYVRYKFRSKNKIDNTSVKSVNQYDRLKTLFYNYY